MQLTDFAVLSFDCYGTLVDWESGIISALTPLTNKLSSPLSRDSILEAHARCESSRQAATPDRLYSDLLSDVYGDLAREWNVDATADECEAYSNSVKDWPAFSDSAESLRYLKEHYKLVILSNVDNASFAGSAKRLGIEFDAVYTAEDIGSYKPSPKNFEYMLERLMDVGHPKDEILHTAESLFHDHVPANSAGLTSCWIYRRHGQSGFGATMKPEVTPRIDFRFDSLSDFVDSHRRLVDV